MKINLLKSMKVYLVEIKFKVLAFILTGSVAGIALGQITSFTASVTKEPCPSNSNGEISISTINANSGGSGSFEYSIDGTNFNLINTSLPFIITGLPSGAVTLILRETSSTSTTISNTFTLKSLNASTSVTNNTCNSSSDNFSQDGIVTITSSDGNSPYTYKMGTNPAQISNSFSSLAPNTYNFSVLDNLGCTYNLNNVVVSEASLITSIKTITNVNCYGGNDGSISLNISGGNSPYQSKVTHQTIPAYSTTYAAGGSISSLYSGSYVVYMKDNVGCVTSFSQVINQPAAALSVTISMSQISCNNQNDGSVTLSPSGGTGGYSYTWTGGPSGWTSPGNVSSLSSLAAGTYNYEVTDANGCKKTGSATIVNPSVLTITESVTNVACYGNSTGEISINMNLTGTSPYQFTWSGPSSFSSNNQNLTGLSSGSYTLNVQDSKGCTTSKTIPVTQPTADIYLTSTTKKDITCFGANDGSIDITPAGGTPGATPNFYTYSWTGPNSYLASSEDITSLNPGNYSVVITDANACTKTFNFTISEPAQLAANTTITNVSCNGGSNGAISLNVSGGTPGYTYSWSNSSTSNSISGLTAGTYSVTIKDALNCQIIKNNISVTEPTALSITGVVTNVKCNAGNDGAIDVTPAGGTTAYTYSWDNTATTQDLTAIKAGDYTLTLTDANGCITSKKFTVTEPTAITIADVTTNVDCNGNSTGSIDITVSGGTASAGYSYSWDDINASSTQDISNLPKGDYTVTVMDDNLCTVSQKISVTEPTALSITETHIDNICNGESKGSIDASVSGGTTTYLYSWTGPSSYTASTEDINGLAAGSYQLTVTDNNSCTITKSVTIAEPTAINASGNITDVLCFGGNDGAIDLSVSGGTPFAGPTYTIAWTGPNSFVSNNEDLLYIEAGSYNFTITDNNGCQISSTINVSQPTDLQLNITSNSVCDGDGTLTFNAFDGTPGYKYEVDGVAAKSPMTNLPDKIYAVQATDTNGCIEIVNVNLAHNDPFKPIVKTKMKVVYLDATGIGSIVKTDIDNGSSDNCAIDSLSLDRYKFSCADVGQNTITLTVVDINSNSKSDTASVFVLDTISPVISVKNATIAIDTSGNAYLTQVIVVTSSSDSCSVDTIVLSKNVFTLSDVGVNSVDITITDASGNKIIKTVSVTVIIADSDLDSIPDYVEKNFDTDGDGVMNYLDLDSDNDAIADLVENASKKTYVGQDFDGDGIPNCLDLDSDDDGINDVVEVSLSNLDVNGDGQKDNASLLVGVPNDQDGDLSPDYLDLDTDGDGLFDAYESQQNYTDANADGIIDGIDNDLDGIKDFADGNSKWKDAFDVRPVDSDLDNIEDWRDTDSDNDLIADATEGKVDTDGDNKPNYLDLDSDADGISDKIETASDFDGDGKGNYIDTDSDADGIDDSIEGTVDTDGDGSGNWLDKDSDADGIDDSVEGTTDTDGDGKGNYIDTDSDADGIDDSVEGTTDTDGDGDPNYIDLDSDGDGILDSIEGASDYDGDGKGNYIDTDADDDELLDAVEGRKDVNNNGKEDYLDAQVTIPEGITPNSDGDNDVLIIKGLKVFPQAEIIVFNRNGQIVYQSGAGYKNDWGGTCNDKLFGTNLPEGIYFYVFKYNNPKYTELTTISGNIYIKP